MEYFLTNRFTAAKRRMPSLNRRALDFFLSCHWSARMREIENLALKMVQFEDLSGCTQPSKSELKGYFINRGDRFVEGRS